MPVGANTERALALLRVCPNCAGAGAEPYNGDYSDPDAEMVSCQRCDGTGDLLDALLARAYRAGRDDALEQMRYESKRLSDALSASTLRSVTLRGIRARIGLND